MLCGIVLTAQGWWVFVMQVNGDSQRTEEQPYGIPDKKVPERWDVVGLGQAMVFTTVTLYYLVCWFC